MGKMMSEIAWQKLPGDRRIDAYQRLNFYLSHTRICKFVQKGSPCKGTILGITPTGIP